MTQDSRAAPAEHSQAGGNATDRMIVKFKDATAANLAVLQAPMVNALGAAAGVTLRHIRPMSGDAHVMGLEREMNADDAWAVAKRLMQDPSVEYAEPDMLMQTMMAPNDPSFSSQWHYQSPAVSPGGANLPDAWDITTGSAALTVAVVDTGLRPHADIASNILDGSGRVVPGYDFVSGVTMANDGDGRDADPTDPGDWTTAIDCGVARNSSWHGTHVAGTIGALSNNGVGVSGINWVSKILPVRVLGKCGGYISDIADGMRWAAGLAVGDIPLNPNPARVLNLSLGGGGGCGTTFQNAINAIVAANAIVVVAAGNSSTDVANATPANCNNVIPVAALGPTGARAYYSNFGSRIGIAAPGGDTSTGATGGVLSTLNSGTTTPDADSYAYYQGTSMAAPHVTGIVSLMLSVNPALNPADVLFILQATARPFPTGTVRDCTASLCGPGVIDAASAVAASSPTLPGFLQFTAATAITSETTEMATLSVTRIGGSNGAASVTYSTVSGLATAGVDFTPTSGILNWADGENVTKTISIPIANDGIAESPETFVVNLSGASGANLGSRSSASVTIVDPEVFPVNATMPAGWVVPSGASAGWLVASDQAFEGIFSLKSEVIGDGQTAQIEVTRVLDAGMISFARRVSSEANYDYLRFYIDGVRQQQSWSGEQPWATVSYPVSAGTHTLRWSYEKDEECCTGGSDAAWIDAVVLPEVDPTLPGTVQFVASTASVSETAGTISVSVSRTIGSNGAASVSYSTVSGSATAGADITAVSGTLNWADGDHAPKTISIPIADDGIAESPELFFVMLSGASGASLGSRNTVTITIADPEAFPPNAALPAGWVVPAAANAGWSVASDQASEGVFSLKSDAVANNQTAQIEVTKVFEAGTISFARRLSGPAYNAYLGFYIDGVLQQSWSGEQPWVTVSYPVSAGTHTLRWSYQKYSGSQDGDAAWIDAVVLPEVDPTLPGAVQFIESTANASEMVGTISVSVSRTFGSNGAASVNYSTVSVTATAGADFTAVNGTLNWADGDHAPKTISIPIANDGIAESPEIFFVMLSGASGASLGSRNTVTITIADPEAFPPNAALPAGWVVPAAANAGWSVASDQASEGVLSLKSDAVANFQAAQIEVTKFFEAGTISFARRLSGPAYNAYLGFYIDGVLQQSWSGEQPWMTVSYPVSTGTHTLRWSYQEYSGSQGSDAAWIDAVVLPNPIILPLAPTINMINHGRGSATIGFTAPNNNGGSPIISYTATCTAPYQRTRAYQSSSSPITIKGLIGGVNYACSVAATNSAGTGPSSATLAVVPLEAIDLTPILMLLLD